MQNKLHHIMIAQILALAHETTLNRFFAHGIYVNAATIITDRQDKVATLAG